MAPQRRHMVCRVAARASATSWGWGCWPQLERLKRSRRVVRASTSKGRLLVNASSLRTKCVSILRHELFQSDVQHAGYAAATWHGIAP